MNKVRGQRVPEEVDAMLDYVSRNDDHWKANPLVP